MKNKKPLYDLGQTLWFSGVDERSGHKTIFCGKVCGIAYILNEFVYILENEMTLPEDHATTDQQEAIDSFIEDVNK